MALLTPAAETAPAPPRRPRRRHLLGFIPAAVILAIAVIGPLLAPYDPRSVVAAPEQPPSGAHWFGTDVYGMDVFSRVLAATSNDLLVGVIATLVATGAGTAIGLLIGTNESRKGLVGAFGRGLNRALDLFDALPQVVVGLVLLGFFGRDIYVLSIVTGALMVPTQARAVRTEVLRVRGEAYLESALISGERPFALVVRHVLPNTIWPALENMSYVFGVAVTIAASLGFLGVGLAPPEPEWGTMIADGATSAASGRWWAALFPCIALAATVLVASHLGHRYFRSRRH